MVLRRRQPEEDSNLSESQSVQETRIEQRRNYTDACTEKRADGQGIARGTNQIYKEVFGTKPDGKRDNWTPEEQKKVAVAENFAANSVRDINPTGSQEQINNAVAKASGDGARDAAEYIEDKKENGNWWGRLF